MKNIFISIKKILLIIPKSKKRRLPVIVILLFFQSISELLGLGALVPVMLSIFNESFHTENAFGKMLFDFFEFSHRNELIIFFSSSLLLLIISKNFLSIRIMKYCSRFSFSLYKELALKLHQNYYNKGFLYFKNTNSSEIWRNIDQATFWFSSQSNV